MEGESISGPALSWEKLKELVSEDLYLTIEIDFHDKKHQSRFYRFKDGFVFILRSFYFAENELNFKNINFLFIEGIFWSYQASGTKEKKNDFKYLCQQWDLFLDVLEQEMEKNKELILLYSQQVDRLEEELYEQKTSSLFMDHWFDSKKDLAKFQRYFTRVELELSSLMRYGDKKEGFSRFEFDNLNNDVSYLNSTIDGLLSRLDNAQNYSTSIKNDRLNRNIYWLTVLSGIFLPLNLIVGFFGMNTEGLFFKDNPSGTMFVIYLLIGIFLSFFLGFHFVKLIDRIFIRWWLGKFTLYQKMSKKFEKLEQNWRYE